MASEQSRIRKKKSNNAIVEVLSRHKDCSPNPTSFSCCEQIRLVGLKPRQEDISNKVAGIEELSGVRTKSLKSTPKKNLKFSKEGFQEQKLNNYNSSSIDKNNEDLSKSRKRRIRKQRLLTTLAPKSNPSLPHEPNLQSKCKTYPCDVNVPLTNNNDNNVIKTTPKDIRKRFDKSLVVRNKCIKTKTLADCSNVTKSDIIKSIEERTLSTLLQTLAPLNNSSPKKERVTTTPIFSFPTSEKKLNCSDSKVEKDSVFYFGETKHQLEKLTSQFNKCNNLHNSVKSLNNSFNFSPLPQTNDKTNSLTSINDSGVDISSSPFSFTNSDTRRLFSFGPSELVSKGLSFKSTEVFQSVLPNDVVSSNINTIPRIIKESKVNNLSDIPSTQLSQEHLIPQEVNMNVNSTKSSNETLKIKSREDILLERESKKAAKLAAKLKSKNNQVKAAITDSEPKKVQVFVGPKHNAERTTTTTKATVELEHLSSSSCGKDFVKKKNSSDIDPESTGKEIITSVVNQVVQDSKREESSNVAEETGSAKSKAELRAKRRAKQEAQRAAKTLGKPLESQQEKALKASTTKIMTEASNVIKDVNLAQIEKKPEVTKIAAQPKPKLFSHLYQERIPVPVTSNKTMKLGKLHPAIVQLGVQYATRVVVGSNARCVALLNALKKMIKDYVTPSEKEFSRGLEEDIGPVMIYLNQCRPLAVSMTNAIRHIKRSLIQLPNTIPDVEARRKMCDLVDTYIHEEIDKAGESICQSVEMKIAHGDVILTYGCSSLVSRILVETHLKGKKFRVIVVDGCPWQEGREMLRRLVDKGLSCTYVLITATSFIMREASKVLLGAHALLANGYVMSRAGSSQVALLAHYYNVPVLVCCETHKFSERVQTDAIVYNEMGELRLTHIKDKENSRVTANLTPLSLAYDITPPDLVSAVVTERAILPCTSVPVILRIKPSESVM